MLDYSPVFIVLIHLLEKKKKSTNYILLLFSLRYLNKKFPKYYDGFLSPVDNFFQVTKNKVFFFFKKMISLFVISFYETNLLY